MRAALIVATILLLTSCADRLNRTFPTWVGAPLDELVNDWGPPDQISTLPNGNRVASYSEEFGQSRRSFWNGKRKSVYCGLEWWSGPDGIIDRVRWRGHRDSCNITIRKRGLGPNRAPTQLLLRSNQF